MHLARLLVAVEQAVVAAAGLGALRQAELTTPTLTLIQAVEMAGTAETPLTQITGKAEAGQQATPETAETAQRKLLPMAWLALEEAVAVVITAIIVALEVLEPV